MRYEKFSYTYPPRAEHAIPPNKLKLFGDDYIAQYKKNGTNSLIFVPPDKQVFTMGRDGKAHKQWEIPEAAKAIYRALPGKGWYVLNGELMHSKVPGIRNITYLHDIIVNDGEYLIGTTYAERYAQLLMLFLHGGEPATDSHWVLDDFTWLARNHKGNFLKLYQSLTAPEDEGIVLKKLDGKLAPRDNTGWTVKCRLPKANFEC